MFLQSDRRYLVFAIAISIFLLSFTARGNFFASKPSLSAVPSKQKYAYCTFLAPSAKAGGKSLNDEDHYFIGVRMLAYQLLHDPKTRTTSSIPLIVLVTPDVLRSKRDRLVKDRATVVEINPISFDWIKPGRERWMRVMDKLHVFELVQFEKVLLLDSDIVIIKCLDGIFDQAIAGVSMNRGRAERVLMDEAPQPSLYTMAANRDTSVEHGLNAGFVLLRPSIEMYQHYLSVAAIPGRFNGSWPEQDLWNYVHRLDGNMPWKEISRQWTANSPSYQDIKSGTASLHEKYWGCRRDQELRGILLKSRFEMEGFFQARDELP